MDQNYLNKIVKAQSIEKVATYIRAFACMVVARTFCYQDADRIKELEKYEEQAQAVERCDSVAQAREHLRTWGYYGRT